MICSRGFSHHCYADDTELYLSASMIPQNGWWDATFNFSLRLLVILTSLAQLCLALTNKVYKKSEHPDLSWTNFLWVCCICRSVMSLHALTSGRSGLMGLSMPLNSLYRPGHLWPRLMYHPSDSDTLTQFGLWQLQIKIGSALQIVWIRWKCCEMLFTSLLLVLLF